jgi:hypothetical protein
MAPSEHCQGSDDIGTVCVNADRSALLSLALLQGLEHSLQLGPVVGLLAWDGAIYRREHLDTVEPVKPDPPARSTFAEAAVCPGVQAVWGAIPLELIRVDFLLVDRKRFVLLEHFEHFVLGDLVQEAEEYEVFWKKGAVFWHLARDRKFASARAKCTLAELIVKIPALWAPLQVHTALLLVLQRGAELREVPAQECCEQVDVGQPLLPKVYAIDDMCVLLALTLARLPLGWQDTVPVASHILHLH